MINLGIQKPGSVVYIPFSTFDSNGASITLTGNATSDIAVYKDGSTTERASASGYTFTADFDSKTGIQYVAIDLADNTTADFWAAGSKYFVTIGDVTINAQTVRFVAATFTIGAEGAILNTTIATLASQTSFTLTSGPAEDDALNGCVVYLHDAASAVQGAFAYVTDYTGSTKTVTLAAAPTFTIAAKDNISFFPPKHVYGVGGTVQTPRDIGASVLLSSGTGTGQLDFTSGILKVDVNTIKTQSVTCAAGVTVLASVGTAATSTAQTGDAFARIGANGAGLTALGDTRLANLDVASSTLATAASLATLSGYVDTEVAAIKAKTDNLPASPANEATLTTIAGYLDTEIAAIKAKTDNLPASPAAAGDIPTAGAIADAVWDEATSGHSTGGTTGAALIAAGSAGDPWSTSLPGAYSAGTAGHIIGNRVDVALSTLATAANLATLSGYVDTEVAAIKAKTDNLPASPAATGDIPTANQNADALLGRNIAGGSSSGRTVTQALCFLRNKWTVAAGTLTVYGTDDTTTSWTATVSTDAAALPVTGNDPA